MVVINQMMMLSPKHQDLQQKVSCWMGKAQSPLKFQTLIFVLEGHYSRNSSSLSLKQAFQSETKDESSKEIIMLVMTISTSNWEEEMVAMTTVLEKLIKESKEKEESIKLQDKKITRLTRKLEKQPARYFIKSLESEKEEKLSIETEVFDEGMHSKRAVNSITTSV